MGAWIETRDNVPPLRSSVVAPCMGAWIETLDYRYNVFVTLVAPCMGAWIETLADLLPYPLHFGRTLYGCVD